MPKCTIFTLMDQVKTSYFVHDKILKALPPFDQVPDLAMWAELYMHLVVAGGPKNTTRAKIGDLNIWLDFMGSFVGSLQKDGWTPSITKAFKKQLKGNEYQATSINRILATLRHFAKFVDEKAPFLAGDPFARVKDFTIEETEWNGLTDRQIILCKSAIDHRVQICGRKNQNPLLEAAIFYTLFHTGLRSFELTSLRMNQYRDKGFHNLHRKGSIFTRKVHVPKEARDWIDRYLEEIRLSAFRTDLAALLSPDQLTGGTQSGLSELQALSSDGYLFVAGRDREVLQKGQRLDESSIRYMMNRIANQASAQLPEKDKFKLSPHMLRQARGRQTRHTRRPGHARQRLDQRSAPLYPTFARRNGGDF